MARGSARIRPRGTPLPPPAVTLDNARAHYGAHPGVGVIDNPRVGCAAGGREEGRKGDGVTAPWPDPPTPPSLGCGEGGCSGCRARQRGAERGLHREPQEEEKVTWRHRGAERPSAQTLLASASAAPGPQGPLT